MQSENLCSIDSGQVKSAESHCSKLAVYEESKLAYNLIWCLKWIKIIYQNIKYSFLIKDVSKHLFYWEIKLIKS